MVFLLHLRENFSPLPGFVFSRRRKHSDVVRKHTSRLLAQACLLPSGLLHRKYVQGEESTKSLKSLKAPRSSLLFAPLIAHPMARLARSPCTCQDQPAPGSYLSGSGCDTFNPVQERSRRAMQSPALVQQSQARCRTAPREKAWGNCRLSTICTCSLPNLLLCFLGATCYNYCLLSAANYIISLFRIPM